MLIFHTQKLIVRSLPNNTSVNLPARGGGGWGKKLNIEKEIKYSLVMSDVST